MPTIPTFPEYTRAPSVLVRHRASGFTLTELLVVIAIIGILVAIIIPVVGNVRKNARQATCGSNLRQIHTAIMLHAADNKGVLIPSDTGVQPSGTPSYVRWYQRAWAGITKNESSLAPYIGGAEALAKITVCPENTDNLTTAVVEGITVKSIYGWPYTVNQAVLLSATQYGEKGRRVRLVELAETSQIPLITDSNTGADWGGDGWTGTYVPAPNQSRIGEPHGGKGNVLWAVGHVTEQTRDEVKAQIARLNR
jgi:prepilin-type N-terminal cleavage/methylation domain-containing protein/prepilin-type processing-associated H-X9-DG protein